MKVEVEVTKKDLFWMNSHMFLTTSGAYKIPIFAWLTMAVIYFYNVGLNGEIIQIVAKLAIFFGWALVIYSVFYILSTITILSGSSDNYGVIGEHNYEIQKNGFTETTHVNETFTNWNGIHSLIKTNNYAYIKIAPLLAHIIQKKCFSSNSEFENFYSMIKTGYESASNKQLESDILPAHFLEFKELNLKKCAVKMQFRKTLTY